MYLLDTNICIYLMKDLYPALSERLLSCSPEEVSVSAITIFELEYGAAKSNWGEMTRSKMHAFLSPFNVVAFDAKDAIAAGNVRAYLSREGTPIGPYDLQIAAQGLTRNMTVVTHNISEFSRVPGLKVEDWVQFS